jgi:excisionase family DNA binding protein
MTEERPRQRQLSLFDIEVSVKWVAKRLRCSEDTVLRLIEAGDLEAYRWREGGWWRISYNSLIDFINRTKAQYLGSDDDLPGKKSANPADNAHSRSS